MEHNAFVLVHLFENFHEHVYLVVHLCFMSEADKFLLNHRLLVVAADYCYQEVEHDHKHEKCLNEPYKPDQIDIYVFED